MRNEHHVVPHPNGGWDIKKAGSSPIIVHTDTQEEAISRARKICKNEHSELVIHGKDGQIQSKDSYGHDPRHARG